MAENVVKLAKSAARLDLRGSNRFKDLLETYLEQSGIAADATRLKKAAHEEIYEMIGDAKEVAADGYVVSVTTYEVEEHVVKAGTRKRLNIRFRRNPR